MALAYTYIAIHTFHRCGHEYKDTCKYIHIYPYAKKRTKTKDSIGHGQILDNSRYGRAKPGPGTEVNMGTYRSN